MATIAGCGGNVQLASFGSSLFFTDAANGKVVALPLVGGAAVDLAVEQLHPTQIAADESGVYWLNRGDGSAGSSRVMKRGFPLDSSSPIALKTAPTTEVIAALALHGGKLYYALGSDVHEIATDENQTDDVVVGVAFYMSAGIPVANGHVAGLAVNAQRVVWATDDSENVDSHPLAPVGDLASSTDLARLGRITGSSGVGKQVAVDESYAYWVTQSIFSRSSVDGSEPHQQAIFSQFEDPMVTFVLSSQRVYGATQGGMIFEHSRTPPVDPTELEEPAAWLARNQMAVRSMVVASDKVYWITGDCEIRSATM